MVSEHILGALDFDSLWKGRLRTTQVEGAIVTNLVRLVDRRRVLEGGTGDGRLSANLRREAKEYAGVDAVMKFLLRIQRKNPTHNDSELLAAANLYHLPFAERTFTLVILVRVYNLLADPDTALMEAARVLVNGGHLLVAAQVRPSIASLVDDTRTFLQNTAGRVSLTFSHAERLPMSMTPIPTWQETIDGLLHRLISHGFDPISMRTSGLEDYIFLRHLPAVVFTGLSKTFPQMGIFPTVSILARKHGDPPPNLLPFREILACPRCGMRMPLPDMENATLGCVHCKFTVTRTRGVLDTRLGVDH